MYPAKDQRLNDLTCSTLPLCQHQKLRDSTTKPKRRHWTRKTKSLKIRLLWILKICRFPTTVIRAPVNRRRAEQLGRRTWWMTSWETMNRRSMRRIRNSIRLTIPLNFLLLTKHRIFLVNISPKESSTSHTRHQATDTTLGPWKKREYRRKHT